MHRMYTPHSPDNVRLTITVPREAYETYLRFAKLTGHSLSRTMGEWLSTTQPAAQDMMDQIVELMGQANAARRLQASSFVLAEQADEILSRIKKNSEEGASGTPGGALRSGGLPGVPEAPVYPLPPPSSNTGGKVPKGAGKGRGQK